MPLSLLSLFLGFVLGVAATAIAWNLSQRTVRNPETHNVTSTWSVQDVMTPGTRLAVVAERVHAGVKLPPQSKLVVSTNALASVPDEVLRACEVRMHPDVRVNAAIGKDRALLFSGSVDPRAHAVVTREHAAVRRLQSDFQRLWSESTPYVEQARVSELAEKDGRHVDVTGKALEVLEFRGRKMLRLTDGKMAVGVVTKQGDVSQYQGGVIRVVGRMHREHGYAYLEADTVTPVGHAPAA